MSANPKVNYVRDAAYRVWLRSQPCIIEGVRGDTVEGIHVGTAGKGIKTHDSEMLPMFHHHHAAAHAKGEVEYIISRLDTRTKRLMLRAYAREQYQLYLKDKK